MRKIPGITRQDEEERLKQIIGIAEDKLEGTKADAQNLEQELHAMQQEFDESDKEQQALWHNTDARFREVNQELRRAAQARKKPYFGRIDFTDHQLNQEESYYIGRSVIAKDPAHPEVIDWRAPIAGVYYDSSLGETSYSVKGEGKFEINLSRKRTYEIENDHLKDFYDSDVVANDELLTKYLAKNKRAVLGEIIATIQQEQNQVIRKKPQHNLIIQGAAGSGKTTVAMHRISYILYNYELEFKPEDFYIIGSNQVLLNYITGVLPELNVYGVSQMTMEQLFVRLLYEDWDKSYQIKPVTKGVTEPVKGTLGWFRDLEKFCRDYEWKIIPRQDVRIEKNHVRLLGGETIERLLTQFDRYSRADKITMLTERLMAKLENELSGKYYSYTAEEKKKLQRYYSTYFGKREWKGSIFELYEEFLQKQAEGGSVVAYTPGTFDVYDLAALAYLYKRIKETEIIREAGHVVIDEAQDFGMMAYAAMKYCLSTCTYTIMGDVSQNISLEYGLNDWSELRELMLPDEFDYFGLLRKSYRNTVEISDYATEILHHGSFQIYPVQPIIRHGEAVQTMECKSFAGMVDRAETVIRSWQDKGLETIAVICKDQEQTRKVSDSLGKKLELLPNEEGKLEFGNGVLVLPLEYTKGLEFDAVLLFDASKNAYPLEDGYVKRLYVAATRALHELAVLYSGELTDLIAKPVPEDKKKQAITQVEEAVRPVLPVEEEKTHEELAREQALLGHDEMDRRNQIGPRRIVISRNHEAVEHSEETPRTTNWALAMEEPEKPARRSSIVKNRKTAEGVPSSKTAEPVRKAVMEPVRKTAPEPTKKELHIYEPEDLMADPYKRPSYMERMTMEKRAAKEKKLSKYGEYGEMPDNQSLRSAGHSRIDVSVRMCLKGKGYLDIVSSYGTLRLEVLDADCIRVCFVKGSGAMFTQCPERFLGKGTSYKLKEGRDTIEILTERILVRVNKKSGEVAFLTPEGKLLLTERSKEPRQVEENCSWTFFAWGKNEALRAKPIPGQVPLKMGSSAKYISFGPESDMDAGLYSEQGYELSFPAGRKTLCCNIPMYGPYVSQEGKNTEYYFKRK